jgi:hypothetical protein
MDARSGGLRRFALGSALAQLRDGQVGVFREAGAGSLQDGERR